ncbi:MAG: hypothetical protein HYR72_24570 [Deltaproteobacteria bacterium]|nr:hypothetical protein [Deltaproteobacteria bacterium]MBI3389277.1 hypothetical protein [Deltaproteobacteria bacterium]
MKPAILVVMIFAAVMYQRAAVASLLPARDGARLFSTPHDSRSIAVAIEGRPLGGRLGDRRLNDGNDNNDGGGNSTSTSCNCSPVNCRDSGYSSAGCQITCQTPQKANCSCGGCGGTSGSDNGNNCSCQ